jgi:hypothetical protein
MSKGILLIVICIGLSACASTKNIPMSANHLTQLEGKTIQIAVRESPSFIALTSGKGMAGVFGVVAAASEGSEFVETNKIVDPAGQIASTLVKTLAERHTLRPKGKVSVVDTASIPKILEMTNEGDYVLDLMSNGWGYMYDGFGFSNYYVTYSAKLRLIDAQSKKVISSGFCPYHGKKIGKKPVTHDTLIADGGVFIKQELLDATKYCIELFEGALFSSP